MVEQGPKRARGWQLGETTVHAHGDLSRSGVVRRDMCGARDDGANGAKAAPRPVTSIETKARPENVDETKAFPASFKDTLLEPYFDPTVQRDPTNPPVDEVNALATKLAPGALVAGRYRVEGVLGSGGMGIVVSARDEVDDVRVAIKCMLGHKTAPADLRARFQREAQIASQLQSSYVVRVKAVDDLDDHTPFMVMDLVDGRDLAQFAKQRGPLPLEEAVEYVVQLCEGLAEVHAHGIVHRDLKPSNIFITHRDDGTPLVKIIDFGVAKAPDITFRTDANAVLGSPRYMPPEQLLSARQADERADVWALGAILYELLTGHPAFDGRSFVEVALRVMSDMPTAVTRERTDVPEAIDDVLRRCLAKSRDARTPSVAQLAEDLLDAIRAPTEKRVDSIQAALRPRPNVAPAAKTMLDAQPALATRIATAPKLRARTWTKNRTVALQGVLFLALAVGSFFLVRSLMHRSGVRPAEAAAQHG